MAASRALEFQQVSFKAQFPWIGHDPDKPEQCVQLCVERLRQVAVRSIKMLRIYCVLRLL